MEEFLTLKDVADRLKVSVKTVRRWVKSGQLRGIRAGKQWRVPESAIEEFVRKGGEAPREGGE
jgi:excisionase family DNA binding protein